MLIFQTAGFDIYRGKITQYDGVRKHYSSEKKSSGATTWPSSSNNMARVTPELDFEVPLRVIGHVQMSQKILKN